jgi:hypothetical protein
MRQGCAGSGDDFRTLLASARTKLQVVTSSDAGGARAARRQRRLQDDTHLRALLAHYTQGSNEDLQSAMRRGGDLLLDACLRTLAAEAGPS